jgi:hypothetical protein
MEKERTLKRTIPQNSGLQEARERIRRCIEEFDPVLNLSDLGLERLPEGFGQAGHIFKLDLSNNKLKKLPPSIGRFVYLEHLDLSRNRLTEIPESIIKLSSLKILNLRGNELSALPGFIGKLGALETLDISRNRLTELPEVFSGLSRLKKIEVDHNKLSSLPKTIGRLTEGREQSLAFHIKMIVELSARYGLGEEFFRNAGDHLAAVAGRYQLSDLEAALFSHFLYRFPDQSITAGDLTAALNCTHLEFLQYERELKELERRSLIYCRREGSLRSYRVPAEVIEAFRTGGDLKAQDYRNLPMEEFFEAMKRIFDRRENGEQPYGAFLEELEALFDGNRELNLVRKIRALRLGEDSLVPLVYFCYILSVFHNDTVYLSPLEKIVKDEKTLRFILLSFDEGTHELCRRKIIEKRIKENDDDMYDNEPKYSLTARARKDLLPELKTAQKQKQKKRETFAGFIAARSIREKALFYNPGEEKKLAELASILDRDNFAAVRRRLAERNMGTGFACLFSGPSGTGKTEAAYQLARKSGRDLFPVNVAEIRSMWVGESEKLTRGLFDRYREAVKRKKHAPILFFNEADAVISRRLTLDAGSRSVDQMENSIQNIILQEMENLNGILIATTNLTGNFDRAFERRFLFKIEFEKPGPECRRAIWKSRIPTLDDDAVNTLAEACRLTGGQIENVAKKSAMAYAMTGKDPSLAELLALCGEEELAKPEPLGFRTRSGP